MLALTKEAAAAVETIVSQPEAPDDAVMRVTGGAAQSNGTGPVAELQLSVVEAPQPDDVVVQGLPMAVEQTTIEYLDDKVLDAEVVDGGVQFRLYQQPDGGLEEAEDAAE
jgi:hypothetical protein